MELNISPNIYFIKQFNLVTNHEFSNSYDYLIFNTG